MFDAVVANWPVVLAFVVAGLVRGYAGFGSALIVMPVAARYLPMPDAIALMALAEIATFPSIVPRAWRDGDRREVMSLALPAMVTAPLGLWVMSRVDGDGLRWVLVAAAGLTLALLVGGWRYRGRVTAHGRGGIGAAAGVLGGLTGLTGPMVILFYLAGAGAAVAKVRANTILFIAMLDLGILGMLLLRGMAGGHLWWLAVICGVPYLLTIYAGQAMFRPDREVLYRRVAYVIIGLAILSGLPIWT